MSYQQVKFLFWNGETRKRELAMEISRSNNLVIERQQHF